MKEADMDRCSIDEQMTAMLINSFKRNLDACLNMIYRPEAKIVTATPHAG